MLTKPPVPYDLCATFNQEKALVGAFSVITNFRMKLFEALLDNGKPIIYGLIIFD